MNCPTVGAAPLSTLAALSQNVASSKHVFQIHVLPFRYFSQSLLEEVFFGSVDLCVLASVIRLCLNMLAELLFNGS